MVICGGRCDAAAPNRHPAGGLHQMSNMSAKVNRQPVKPPTSCKPSCPPKLGVARRPLFQGRDFFEGVRTIPNCHIKKIRTKNLISRSIDKNPCRQFLLGFVRASMAHNFRFNDYVKKDRSAFEVQPHGPGKVCKMVEKWKFQIWRPKW